MTGVLMTGVLGKLLLGATGLGAWFSGVLCERGWGGTPEVLGSCHQGVLCCSCRT